MSSIFPPTSSFPCAFSHHSTSYPFRRASIVNGESYASSTECSNALDAIASAVSCAVSPRPTHAAHTSATSRGGTLSHNPSLPMMRASPGRTSTAKTSASDARSLSG